MRFHDILASIIHDMKNSLGMVINALGGLAEKAEQTNSNAVEIQALQQEATRINNNLIELLTLYKIENERVSANINEINIADFLGEIVLENQAIASAERILLESQCDADLVGYFDDSLVRGVLNNLVDNGMRYTDDRLLISAEQDDGYLVIQVEDNGRGYPKHMLEAQQATSTEDGLIGHTQLGIYFSSMIAELHHNRDKKGFIRLSNNNRLSGGCFSICLP